MKDALLHWKERKTLIIRDRTPRPREFCTNRTWQNNSDLSSVSPYVRYFSTIASLCSRYPVKTFRSGHSFGSSFPYGVSNVHVNICMLFSCLSHVDLILRPSQRPSEDKSSILSPSTLLIREWPAVGVREHTRTWSSGRPEYMALKVRQARDPAFRSREEHVKRFKVNKRLTYSKKPQAGQCVWNTGGMGDTQ